MQSINAFFHSSKDTTRHPSDASGSTIAEESDEIQIKADDIEKNLSTSVALSTKKSTDTGSHSSTSTSQEGETVADDNNVDPFAGGVEGGVTYQSLTWWYVVPSRLCQDEDVTTNSLSGTPPLGSLQKLFPWEF